MPPLDLPFTDDLLRVWLDARQARDTWAQLLAGFTMGPPSDAVVDNYFADVARADERGLRALFDVCRSGGFAELLPNIVCPTLVVAGTHDQGFPPALLRDTVQRAVPGARLVSIACGHEIPLEQPSLTAALLEAFLASRHP